MKKAISLLLAIVMVILIIPPVSFSAQAADYATELKKKGFPDSYIPSLVALHDTYPNWKFEPLAVGESFSTAVANERKHGSKTPGHNQQLIQNYSANNGKGYYCECSYCKKNGAYVVQEKPNWVSASDTAVSHYLDPRNFLNEEYIFQFESTAYNSAHTQTGVEYILSGTWMHNANITYKDANGNNVTYKNSSGNTVKYSQAIMEAAKNSKMSAYYLASKIVQEVGGTSATAGGASGTSTTYPGIYNYYNINAFTGASDGLKWAAVTGNSWVTNTTCRVRSGPSTDTTELVMLPSGTTVTYIATTEKQPDGYKWINVMVTYSGKTYNGYIREDLLTYNATASYNRPWTNPYLSIYNGAQWIADHFKTQFTGYLQKFNVNPASGSSKHMNEYMTNVQGAASEAAKTYKAYKNANLLSDSIVFTIPVYTGMPAGNLATPQLSSVSNTASGVQIDWKSVAGAELYGVYRKTGSSGWSKIGETLHNSFVDKTVSGGTKYTYTIRCLTADGKSYTSNYDTTGLSITFVAAPKISSVSVDNTGTVIKWNAPAGAVKYRVYYKTGSSGWTKIADTTSTSYTWTGAKSGTKYSFTVRCISSDAKSYTSGYDSTGKSITYSSAPVISSVSNGATGVQLSWDKSAGAELYRVYYKTGSGSWTKIADTTSNSYTWTGAVSNTTYAFTVRCLTSDAKAYTSGYNTVGKSIKYIAAPKISSLSTTATGIQINWGKVSGAAKYRVFYKNSSGGWTKIADTTSTSYNWTGAKSGANYTFTVRCISSDAKSYTSGYDGTGKSVNYTSTPVISSVSNVATGVQINWGKVDGSELYRVFYKNSSGGWTKIADTTSTSYTWTGAKSGTKYTFTVRCLTGDAKAYTSSYDSVGKSIKYIAAPKLSSVSNTATGVNITWEKSTGAEKYRVFYKNSSGGWTKIADTTSNSYTWTGVKSGTTYTFTVRCISSDAKSYTSAYDSKGISICYIAAPVLTSVSVGNAGVTVSWGKVSGADAYRVFYKTGSGSWTKIADTTSNSYTWTGAQSGTKYTFTVRCVSSDGKNYTSAYDSKGLSITYIAAPELTSAEGTSTGIKIKWKSAVGAELYKVYRKTGDGSWTAIGTTSFTDFVDMQAAKGKTYSYTVRCVDSTASKYMSGYDTVGKTATSISNPSTKNDMVAMAETQLGISGGQKYWSWAGYSSRVPWCNIFVTWCADQLGYYQSGRIPLIQAPSESVKWFKERGLFKGNSYIPKAGDLIYFVHYGETEPYHIGIVEKYENGKVYTVEGNSGDVVKKKTYTHGTTPIYGYATPDYGHN